jgi:hypothetical protein
MAVMVECREALGGSVPAEGLAWSAVKFGGDGCEVVVVVDGQVGSLGEVLPQPSVGVLVGPALPWTVGLAEEQRHAGAASWTPSS